MATGGHRYLVASSVGDGRIVRTIRAARERAAVFALRSVAPRASSGRCFVANSFSISANIITIDRSIDGSFRVNHDRPIDRWIVPRKFNARDGTSLVGRVCVAGRAGAPSRGHGVRGRLALRGRSFGLPRSLQKSRAFVRSSVRPFVRSHRSVLEAPVADAHGVGDAVEQQRRLACRGGGEKKARAWWFHDACPRWMCVHVMVHPSRSPLGARETTVRRRRTMTCVPSSESSCGRRHSRSVGSVACASARR